jgi:glycosyltransferase involved in cell wall biosynthesis
MKIGIDLLHIKPGHTGGIESYIRNLLKGFGEISLNNIEFLLFVSNNNEQSFRLFTDEYNSVYKSIKCNINSFQVAKRILWENIYLDKLAYELGVNIMFIPTYNKPIFRTRLPYIITVHDLRVFHFPQDFSFLKKHWLYFAYKRCVETATKVVAISEFVKSDIISTFRMTADKITTIYNAIDTLEQPMNFHMLEGKYNIKPKGYFYTISSLLPHKNTETLVKLIAELKKSNNGNVPNKLIISGVGDGSKLKDLLIQYNIEENVVFTGFISDEERNALYTNCYAFLFPSVFEGFGMPPVEAMMFGVPVITTKCTSIPEVTQGRAIYVDDPWNVNDWMNKIYTLKNIAQLQINFPSYELHRVTQQYLDLFFDVYNEFY